ncbi:helix-turn-helix domain-containing protein [Mycoplasmatota bacterium WC44]
MKELFSPQEVAMILDVHVKTVRRYLRDGTLKGIKIGGSWKVSLEELSKHLNDTIPSNFDDFDRHIKKGKGKIKRSLLIEIDVVSQVEANKFAQALMDIINSNEYSDCNFQYQLDNNVAKFIINGSREYLNSMMLAIEGFEVDEDK